MHAIAEKHFKAWGDIDRIKVLTDKGVAFVTYQNRLNAEFAKEAMANQSLDHNELIGVLFKILNIRWATGDPNPKVQAINKRKAVEMVQQAIESKLSTEFKEAQHLPGSEDLGLKKRSKQEENNGTEAPTPTLYLGADGQYYYDYGDYGYNHETQQYDPARLDNYSGLVNSGKSKSPAASSILLQDRIKATLLSKAPSLPSTSPSLSKDAKETNLKPATSALGALATYGSDSESSEGE
ncbi:Pre-mRNA-splicing factor [Modicella reniformis]|uniref:Pre-mRNA-splicing factor n=1 Tax=Modicella reniformis TaxID=1440133 RepID=A0A9P6IJL9_9FUNG|nr:Pre-mRNA-splicing factor [Modicella reniformis]